MEKTELQELTNIDVYKAVSMDNDFAGYIFSIKDTDNPENERFRYYMISHDKNNKPILRKLNNIINMLNSGQLTLQKLDEQNGEILNFLRMISSIETQTPEINQATQHPNFFSTITEEDVKLLKPKF